MSKRIGNRAYALYLPRSYKLHNVFHVDVLRRAHSSQPLRQAPLSVGPDPEDAEGEEFVVEKISAIKQALLPENEACGYSSSPTILAMLSQNGRLLLM